MNYRGYAASVAFDPESRTLFGRVDGLRDTITFEAEDVASLEREFHLSVDEYLRFCEESGRAPERPFSGRVLVRMPPELHRQAARAARTAGVSMNRWIVDTLAGALANPPAPAVQPEGDGDTRTHLAPLATKHGL